jgi:hypothetical protein
MKEFKRRKFIFTDWNMSEERTEEWRKFMSKYKLQFGGFSHEIGPKSGKPHRHGVLVFNSVTTIARLHKKFHDVKFLIMFAKEPAKAWAYCIKDSFYQWTIGKLPATVEEQKTAGRKAGVDQKERYAAAIALARSEDWDTLASDYPDMLLRFTGNLKKVAELLETPAQAAEPVCEWYYGETGVGKSRYVRAKYEVITNGRSNIFDKGLNKWWDGYRAGQIALIEEVDDESHKFLAFFLKRWADRYTFSCETKGGHRMNIRPPIVIVTSNFRIAECWTDRQAKPLLRRFKEINCRAASDLRPTDPGTTVIYPTLAFLPGGEFYKVDDCLAESLRGDPFKVSTPVPEFPEPVCGLCDKTQCDCFSLFE